MADKVATVVAAVSVPVAAAVAAPVSTTVAFTSARLLGEREVRLGDADGDLEARFEGLEEVDERLEDLVGDEEDSLESAAEVAAVEEEETPFISEMVATVVFTGEGFFESALFSSFFDSL